MDFKEELLWILDKNGASLSDKVKYQQNIDFVHSLGKKCDSVGWSKLDLDDPDADNVLDSINDFCRKNEWTARGWYDRTYMGFGTEWFKLETAYFKDAAIADKTDVPAENGGTVPQAVIRAYHEQTPSPKEWLDIAVPERFRNACMKHGITDVDFCWIQDKGKYEAEQYFHIYPNKMISRFASTVGLTINDHARIDSLGGCLPKIASIFSVLQVISTPDCYLSSDMPDGGIAFVYYPESNSCVGRNAVLIHQDTAELLIREKALSPRDLSPVPIVDSCPNGYVLKDSKNKNKPSKSYISDSIHKYEALKQAGRPARKISEKDAIKALRTAKSNRKDDFSTRISRTDAERIANSEYAPFLPYLQVANGGCLSDEYTMLTYKESVTATEKFYLTLQTEELLDSVPKGYVIAKCTNGDSVLIIANGNVIRFSHEAPGSTEEWESMAYFIFDALSEP